MKIQLNDMDIDTIELNLEIIESQIERYMNDVYAINHTKKCVKDIRTLLNKKVSEKRNHK